MNLANFACGAFYGEQNQVWNTTCRRNRVRSDDPDYKELCAQYLASIKALRMHVARYHLRSLWIREIESGKNFTPPSAPRDAKNKPPRN
jgi:hypothetical protein